MSRIDPLKYQFRTLEKRPKKIARLGHEKGQENLN